MFSPRRHASAETFSAAAPDVEMHDVETIQNEGDVGVSARQKNEKTNKKRFDGDYESYSRGNENDSLDLGLDRSTEPPLFCGNVNKRRVSGKVKSQASLEKPAKRKAGEKMHLSNAFAALGNEQSVNGSAGSSCRSLPAAVPTVQTPTQVQDGVCSRRSMPNDTLADNPQPPSQSTPPPQTFQNPQTAVTLTGPHDQLQSSQQPCAKIKFGALKNWEQQGKTSQGGTRGPAWSNENGTSRRGEAH